MDEPVLEGDGLIKEFGSGVVTRVLHGVDVTLSRGELVALIGPSGSGKSTSRRCRAASGIRPCGGRGDQLQRRPEGGAVLRHRARDACTLRSEPAMLPSTPV